MLASREKLHQEKQVLYAFDPLAAPANAKMDDLEEDGLLPTKKAIKQIRLDLHRTPRC